MLIKKWSKNHNELMHPYRVIAPQSSKEVFTQAVFMNFTPQQLCEDASDHHSSLITFDQHSMHCVR